MKKKTRNSIWMIALFLASFPAGYFNLYAKGDVYFESRDWLFSLITVGILVLVLISIVSTIAFFYYRFKKDPDPLKRALRTYTMMLAVLLANSLYHYVVDADERQDEVSIISEEINTNSFLITGVYNGKNVYITNGYREGVGNFCIHSIHVNEVVTRKNYDKTSTIELYLDGYGIKCGDPVSIKIKHFMDECETPYKILNPEVLNADYGCKLDE